MPPRIYFAAEEVFCLPIVFRKAHERPIVTPPEKPIALLAPHQTLREALGETHIYSDSIGQVADSANAQVGDFWGGGEIYSLAPSAIRNANRPSIANPKNNQIANYLAIGRYEWHFVKYIDGQK